MHKAHHKPANLSKPHNSLSNPDHSPTHPVTSITPYKSFNGKFHIGFYQESAQKEDNGESPQAKQADAPLGFLQDRQHPKIQFQET